MRKASYQTYGASCSWSMPCDSAQGLVCSYTGYNPLTGTNINPDCQCPVVMNPNQCDW